MKQVDSIYGRASVESSSRQLAVSRFVSRTYGWMFLGLLITGCVSLAVASSESAIQFVFGNQLVRSGLMIAEFGLVFALATLMPRMSAAMATLGFLAYSALTGVTLSAIFMVYTTASVSQVFMTAAGMFGGLALFGTLTRKDLTGVGTFFGMGLWGLIIVGFANLFLKSDALGLGMSAAGVLIFSGLTAYDAQRIRGMAYEYAGVGFRGGEVSKGAIYGALTLYLDFINLFLNLLRLFGSRRD